jgi:hypothetical protein
VAWRSAAWAERWAEQKDISGVIFLLKSFSQSVLINADLSSANPGVAWLEFATWSRQLARYHFQSNPPSPARFTISFP